MLLREVFARRGHDRALRVLRRHLRVAQRLRDVTRTVFQAELVVGTPSERPDAVVPEEQLSLRDNVGDERRAARLVGFALLRPAPDTAPTERLAERTLPDGLQQERVAADCALRDRADGGARLDDHAVLDAHPGSALRDDQRVVLPDALLADFIVDPHDLRVELHGGLHPRTVLVVAILRRVAAGIGEAGLEELQEVVALEVADDDALAVRPRHDPVLRGGPLRRQFTKFARRERTRGEQDGSQNATLH